MQLLVNLLRAGLVRSLGNITVPKLYNRSFSGTKYLIDEYIAQVAETVDDITTLPTAFNAGGQSGAGALTNQTKLDFIHDTRQAFGRSTLVLQGGAIFGLCHLGVVKALFLRGLLPRILTGIATGALIAALVAIHTEDELPKILEADGIDLTAFTGKTRAQGRQVSQEQTLGSRWDTLMRRIRRFSREGYFLDVTVLEAYVRANVGDLTFEEAYNRSKRILNITVATEGQGGVPTLLNYITAPNVVSRRQAQSGGVGRALTLGLPSQLIWTATIASNASSPSFYGQSKVMILCKDAGGSIVPWAPANTIDFRHWTSVVRGSRLAAAAHLGALQRQPLHREPSAAVPDSLSAVGHARAVAGRGAQQNDAAVGLFHPHGRGRGASSAATDGHAATAPVEHPALSGRRAGAGGFDDAGARGDGGRLCAAARDADARDA